MASKYAGPAGPPSDNFEGPQAILRVIGPRTRLILTPHCIHFVLTSAAAGYYSVDAHLVSAQHFVQWTELWHQMNYRLMQLSEYTALKWSIDIKYCILYFLRVYFDKFSNETWISYDEEEKYNKYLPTGNSHPQIKLKTQNILLLAPT